MVSAVGNSVGNFIMAIVHGAPQKLVGTLFEKIGVTTVSTVSTDTLASKVGHIGHQILGVPSAPFEWLGALIQGMGECVKNNAMLIGTITAVVLLILLIKYCRAKWSDSRDESTGGKHKIEGDPKEKSTVREGPKKDVTVPLEKPKNDN